MEILEEDACFLKQSCLTLIRSRNHNDEITQKFESLNTNVYAKAVVQKVVQNVENLAYLDLEGLWHWKQNYPVKKNDGSIYYKENCYEDIWE